LRCVTGASPASPCTPRFTTHLDNRPTSHRTATRSRSIHSLMIVKPSASHHIVVHVFCSTFNRGSVASEVGGGIASSFMKLMNVKLSSASLPSDHTADMTSKITPKVFAASFDRALTSLMC
jgi:hypothetical protein